MSPTLTDKYGRTWKRDGTKLVTDGIELDFDRDLEDDEALQRFAEYQPADWVEPVDPEQMLATVTADYEQWVQERLDAGAQVFGYDNISSACTYAGDKNPKFAAQGAAFKDWRSDTWTTCYALLGEVQAGTRAVPTLDELDALLPAVPDMTPAQKAGFLARIAAFFTGR